MKTTVARTISTNKKKKHTVENKQHKFMNEPTVFRTDFFQFVSKTKNILLS